METQKLELAALKQIPILQVAAGLGLDIVGRGSPRYITLQHAGIKIVANTGKNVWTDNAGNGGSVIDLVMHVRRCGMGHARVWLRSAPALARTVATNPIRTRPQPPQLQIRPAGLATQQYLHSRGLIDKTIMAAIKSGVVAEIRQHGYTNACLIHQDAQGKMVGGEVRGSGFKAMVGDKTGLFQFHIGCNVALIVVTESAIDALSYAQLFAGYDALVISTGGTPSREQLECLRDLLHQHPAADLVGAQDADLAGDSQANCIAAIALEMCRDYARHRPVMKDWNDSIPPLLFPTARL